MYSQVSNERELKKRKQKKDDGRNANNEKKNASSTVKHAKPNI